MQSETRADCRVFAYTPGMRTSSAILALSLTACTPSAWMTGVSGVTSATCAVGQAADVAGQDWGAIVSSAICWATRFAEDQANRMRDRELEAAARKLSRALDEDAKERTAETVSKVASAHAECLALE